MLGDILHHVEARALEAESLKAKLIEAEAGLKAHKDACEGISALVAGEPEAKTGGPLVDCVKAVLERLRTDAEKYRAEVVEASRLATSYQVELDNYRKPASELRNDV